MRAVNLLPGATRARRVPAIGGLPAAGRLTGVLALAGAVAVLGGLGYAGHGARQDADRLAERTAEADARRTALRAELEDFRAEAAAVALQEARRGAIVSLVTGRTDWERVIRDVATVIPPGVWLTSLGGDAGAAAPADPSAAPGAAVPAAGAPTITIEALGPDQGAVAATMARLGVVAGISHPRLVSSAFEDVAGRRMVRFSVTASIDMRAQGRAQLAPVADAPEVRP